MKKIQLTIAILSLLGILVEVLNHSFNEGFIEGISLFKYYTLQSNLIVFLLFLFLYLDKQHKWTKMFLPAGMIYITITFVVFLIFLQPIYHPEGWGIVGNILLHYVTPLVTIGYTMYYRNHYRFEYNLIKLWIIYPVIYLVFAIIHGVITNDYLYPFFQVSEIGVSGLILSSVGLTAFFIVVSFLTVKIVSKNQNAKV